MLTRAYPGYYGGAYVNDETGKLVVLIKGMGNEGIREISTLAEGSDVLEYQSCEVSFNEMVEVIDILTDNIASLRDQGVRIDSIYDDIMKGRVVVAVQELDGEKERTIRAVVDRKFLSFENSEGVEDDYGLGGGNKVTCGGNSGTIGFAATRRDGQGNTVSGFVVAGHVAGAVNTSAYYNGAKIGTVSATSHYNNSTADAAFITASNGTIPAPTLPNGATIYNSGQVYANPVNTTVYMYGAVSGLQQGKVKNVNVVFVNENNVTTKQCNRADYVCVKGDSGAPVMVKYGNVGGNDKYILVGINKGFYWNNLDSCYCPYENIVNELNVTCILGY